MRILRVIVSMDPKSGGPCQGIRNSVPALQKLGIENDVVCFDDPKSDFLGKDDFKITAIGPALNSYSYTSALKPLLTNIITNYSVIIIHGLWQYNSYGTYRIWKSLKEKGISVPRLYVMPHGMLDPYFQRAPERKLKALRNRVFWKLVEKKVINGVDGVLFTCEQELILARTTFPNYHPKEEFDVGYGIEAPPEKKAKQLEAFEEVCPEVSNTPYWLFLSRIHPKKGVELLIKAYRQVIEEGKSLPPLVIAGPGLDTTYGVKVLKLASGLPIYFPGMLRGNQKWGALYGCEAFILPSHQENFGIAVVEALACSKPVLISKQVNIWREIYSAEGALVFNDNFKDVLNSLIEFVNISTERKKSLEINARSVFEKSYTVEAAALRMKSTIL